MRESYFQRSTSHRLRNSISPMTMLGCVRDLRSELTDRSTDTVEEVCDIFTTHYSWLPASRIEPSVATRMPGRLSFDSSPMPQAREQNLRAGVLPRYFVHLNATSLAGFPKVRPCCEPVIRGVLLIISAAGSEGRGAGGGTPPAARRRRLPASQIERS
jgi:hypothetical protein